jgi:signal transduction histidine kinase
LHRFHQIKRQDNFWLAQPGLADEMWIGSNSLPMTRTQPDGTSVDTQVKVPNAILRASADHVWVGTSGDLWEFGRGTERRWPLPVPTGLRLGVQALALEGDGRLLVSLARHGLWRFDNGDWQQDPRLRGMSDPTPISMLRDTHGKTWLGLTNNRVGVLTADALQLLPASSNLQIGNTLSMLDAGGRMLIGGDMGVAWIDGNSVRPMAFQRRAPVQRVTGLVLDRLGQLWLHCNDGLLRVPAAELAKFWRTPAQALDSELFNFEDGVNGSAAPTRPLPSLSLDSEGRVYYATMAQAGWIDPAQIRRNPRAPDVIIQSLQTADGELHPSDDMRLPGHPTAVDISFAATALSIPERVRLKYRLEGVDPGWREAQRDRSAHYTNLAPGAYRFHVIAANEDGVWNTQGATLRFHIAPQFWQTWWFRLLCTVLLLLAVAALYRWRIATLKRRADERARALVEATLQERGRIARSLHDNLLQAVQALILRFHTLQGRMPQEPDLQARLDTVLVHAQELVENARDEVVGLRSDPLRDELFAALRSSVAATAPAAESLLYFSTTGVQRPLREEIMREVFYVLREALWNSARHAQASRIAVELCYGEQALTAMVCDDGIGIDANADAASTGHWGIVGMRERVQRMGGQIVIGAGVQAGAVVRFTIPAQLAYA